MRYLKTNKRLREALQRQEQIITRAQDWHDRNGQAGDELWWILTGRKGRAEHGDLPAPESVFEKSLAHG